MNITNNKNINPFPIHFLPCELQDVIQRTYAETQAPYPLIASALLSVMGLSCQDLYEVEIKKNMYTPLVLFQIILAESGERKSSVDKLLTCGVREIEEKWNLEYQQEIQIYQTDLPIWEVESASLRKILQHKIKNNESFEEAIFALKECESRKPKVPIRKRIIINDISKSAIKKELGTGWSSLSLYSDEAGSILSSELADDTPLLNLLWSNGSINVDRANSSGSFKIKNARLGCMLMMQPKLFSTIMERDGEKIRSTGFPARVLFCEPISTIGSRTIQNEEHLLKQSSSDALNHFNQRTKELLQLSANRRINNEPRVCLQFSPEAKARWNDEFNRIETLIAPNGPLVNYRDYASKHSEHVARIAGVIEGFSTGNQYISGSTMYAAIQIANWYLYSFILIMDKTCISDEIKSADLLDRWLNENKCFWINYVFPKNHILKFGPNCIRSKKLLENALAMLNQRGVVNLFKIGRTSFVQYTIHNGHSNLI